MSPTGAILVDMYILAIIIDFNGSYYEVLMRLCIMLLCLNQGYIYIYIYIYKLYMCVV